MSSVEVMLPPTTSMSNRRMRPFNYWLRLKYNLLLSISVFQFSIPQSSFIFAQAMLFMVSASMIAFAIASSESPFIVAHKKASLTKLKGGSERVSVAIDIYNQGSVTAFDVSLTDDSWPVDLFTVVSGNTSISWEKLDGGSSVSHSFELESKMKGPFQGAPAVIKFRVPTKAALQEAYSSPIFPLDINAETIPEDKLEWAKNVLKRVGPQVSVLSIVSMFIYLVASPSKSNAAKGSKKRR